MKINIVKLVKYTDLSEPATVQPVRTVFKYLTITVHTWETALGNGTTAFL